MRDSRLDRPIGRCVGARRRWWRQERRSTDVECRWHWSATWGEDASERIVQETTSRGLILFFLREVRFDALSFVGQGWIHWMRYEVVLHIGFRCEVLGLCCRRVVSCDGGVED